MLTGEEKAALRQLAEETLADSLSADDPHPEEGPPTLPDGPLTRPGSAFVTLYKQNRLRGCVGMIGDRFPLADAVRRAARAALTDPRFPAVTSEELNALTMSVSVLSPFERTEDPEALTVGEHGVYVVARGASALLLPRVASDRGWDARRLLSEVCRKAGLPPDEWRSPDAEVFLFTAEEF
jgi:AmmeMemoRadiSam system protein A